MPLDNQREEFCKRVCAFVKYKRAHKEISQELENHIEDHMEYLMELGLSKEEAEIQSVEAMGNPEEIGKELDKQHRPLLGWVLNLTSIFKVIGIIYCLWALFILGWIIIISLPVGSGFTIDKEHVLYTENLNEKQKAGAVTYQLKKLIVMDNNTLFIRYNSYSDSIDSIFRGWSHPTLRPYDEEGNPYHGGGRGSGVIISRHQQEVENFDLGKETIILKAETYYGDIVFKIPIKGVK